MSKIRGDAPPAEIVDLADDAHIRWITAVIRAEVRFRLVAWPGRAIGAHDENDLVNSVLVALLEDDRAKLREFDARRGKAQAWVREFTRRRVIETERKQLRRRDLSEAEPLPPPPEPSSETPETWFQYMEQSDRLIACLKKTAPPEDLDLFFLLFIEGMSNPEVAERRAMQVEQVASRKFAIRRRIISCLEGLE